MQDNKAKIFLNMILSETESAEMVKRAIDSVANYVDGMYVAVTYNTEQPSEDHELVKLLNTYGANIFYFKWIKSFAAARQFVMDYTPHGVNNYIFWIDADDVLKGGEHLRRVSDEATAMQHAAVFFNYLYQVDLDEYGEVREVIIEHKRERLIRNDGTFKWIGMLHETLIEQRTENIMKIARDECTVIHLSSSDRSDKSLGRNIDILEEQAKKENHKDPRTIIYLAKAYFDKAKLQTDTTQQKILYELALTLFTEYLQGVGTPGNPGYQEGSGWPEERATAWAYISEIARMNSQYDVAIDALHNAIKAAPEYPNYYVDMAMTYGMMKDNKKAKHWLRLATEIPTPTTTLVTTPRDLKVRALEVDYNIALSDGNLAQAERDSELLNEIIPNFEPLMNRHALVKSLHRDNKASQSIVYLGKYLEEKNERQKIIPLIQSIPTTLQQEQFVAEMKHEFLPPRNWEENEITILCGPGVEIWSPKSIQTGLGGSEEAVVYLSQELTKLGWKVTVYANPGPDVGDHQGVVYLPWYDLNWKDNFNVLVLWRVIGFVDLNPKAKYIVAWMHDIPSNPDFTQERVGKIDKIIPLSEYHKSVFRMHTLTGEFVPMPEEKLFVSSNGIIKPNLNTKWIRKPYSMLYVSSADRGLIYLLNNWSKIREQVPEATLDVFYGFQVYDVLHGNNPARMAWKEHLLGMMKQEGISYKGRIGHTQLNKEFATHAIWAYPTDFTEINCISAMKAQACGAIPVTTNFAALKETVKNGIRVDVDITTKEGQEAYFKVLVEMLKDEKKQQEIRKSMMDFAQDFFLWSKVATAWNDLFKAGLKGGGK